MVSLVERSRPGADRLRGRPAGPRRPDAGQAHRRPHQGQSPPQHEGAAIARGNLRALFAFDPRKTAIVLLGGDKTNDWRGWYERNVPRADDLYDDYLSELREEGAL